MLRSKDVNKELKRLDDYAKDNLANEKGIIVKALSLVVKLLRDIRTNQVTDLKSRGVKLIEDGKGKEESDE